MRISLRRALGARPAELMDVQELDARWRALSKFETALDTSTETGAAIASAVARAKWIGSPMDAAREPMRRWELMRDAWKGNRPIDLEQAARDLLQAEALARQVSGYAVPAAPSDAVQGASRGSHAAATFDRIAGRWRMLFEWVNGEPEPADGPGKAAWRVRALERSKKSSLVSRWLDFEGRWIRGEAEDDEVFTGGYVLDLAVAEKRAGEKGYPNVAWLEPADRIVPHPEDMPNAKAAKAVLEEAENLKRTIGDIPEGIAKEIIPGWLVPWLQVGAFGLGFALIPVARFAASVAANPLLVGAVASKVARRIDS